MKKILYTDVNITRTGEHIDNFLKQNKILPSGQPLFFTSSLVLMALAIEGAFFVLGLILKNILIFQHR